MQLFFYIKYFICLIFSNGVKLKNVKKQKQRDIPLVLSLFSNLKNLKQLELCLLSLFNQNILPNKIILYIDKDKYSYLDLPYEITKFVQCGLKIELVTNIGEYSPIYYSLLNHNGCINIIVNEKFVYPENWLEILYLNSIVHNENILIMKAKNLLLDANNEILPFKEWNNTQYNRKPNDYNFPIIEHGILFPPKCFKKEFFRKDIFLKYAPTFPAIWIWTMAILNNKKFYIIEQKNIFFKDLVQKIILKIFRKNFIHKFNKIDKELNQLWQIYGNLILNKLLK